MLESQKCGEFRKWDKDNIGWRYCLFMMLLCFLIGLLLHNLWVQYQDSRYARVWEADKIKTLDRCVRMSKLAIGVTTTEQPGPPEMRAWIAEQTARDRVPEALLQDYDDWQVLRAMNAALAQLEYFELKDRLPEDHRFRKDMKLLGEIIYGLYADGGRPIGAN